MKINTEQINKENSVYEIPEGWLVLNLFQRNILDRHFFILGQNLSKKDMYGIFYFDGISNLPTSYETFYDRDKA